jgi:hypothetical protein
VRWVELIALYVALPLTLGWAFERFAYRRAMAPLLWVASILALVLVLGDGSFDRGVLSRMPLGHPYVRVAALRFFAFVVPLLAFGRWLAPDEFLRLPRERPLLWLALAALYPVLSVVPQGILFRVFFVARFGALFDSRLWLLVAGALAFSLGHVVFRNAPALLLTAVGGALFLDTYLHTQSMLLAAAEHGVYGIVAFTAGLGKFLYLGGRPREVSADMAGIEVEDSRR